MATEGDPNIEIRALIALVISLAILAGWQYFFAPPPPPPQPEAEPVQGEELAGTAQEQGPVAAEPEQGTTEEPAPADEGGEQQLGAIVAETEEQVVIETGRLRTTLTNQGGRISSLILSDFRGDLGGPLELVVGAFAEEGELPFGIITPESPDLAATANEALHVMTVEGGTSSGGVRTSQSEPIVVRWRWSDGAGWLVEKSLTFPPDSHLLELTARIRTPRNTPAFLTMGPGLQSEVDASTRSFYLTSGGVALREGGVEHWAYDDLETALEVNGRVGWGGVESNYFAALFVVPERGGRLYLQALPWPAVPGGPTTTEEGEAQEERSAGVRTGIYVPSEGLDIPLYIGPKRRDLLATYGHDLQNAVDFGFFAFLAYPLLVALNWVYGYVGNYGLAIILLTVVLKILFLPLTHSSMKSMRKMQKLQPEMAAIRARYKGAKEMDKRQEMNNEIMGLYKQHGVSPLGGCLPLLLQMPFLFAFYSCLSVAIEIRHAPFMLWITDLSRFDPYYVLPVLMGVSMYAQQRMTPTTADPVQARIFRFMPVMFTFIFLGLPSGLVLYWFVNNLLGIAQQVVINRQVEAESPSDGAAPATKNAKPKGKGEKAAKRSQSKRGKR